MFSRRGSSAMTRTRCSGVKRSHPSISARLRPHPMQSAEMGSTIHTLLHGLSMSAMGRFSERRAQDKHRRAEDNAVVPRAYIPILNIRFLLKLALADGGVLVGPDGIGGCSGGAGCSSGASAAITRSGGNVMITSVPIRSFDLSEKVPPWRSMRLFAIGRPRPAPCSADLIEFEPCPNEASTIGISSSEMPGPVSLTLMYCPP